VPKGGGGPARLAPGEAAKDVLSPFCTSAKKRTAKHKFGQGHTKGKNARVSSTTSCQKRAPRWGGRGVSAHEMAGGRSEGEPRGAHASRYEKKGKRTVPAAAGRTSVSPRPPWSNRGPRWRVAMSGRKKKKTGRPSMDKGGTARCSPIFKNGVRRAAEGLKRKPPHPYRLREERRKKGVFNHGLKKAQVLCATRPEEGVCNAIGSRLIGLNRGGRGRRYSQKLGHAGMRTHVDNARADRTKCARPFRRRRKKKGRGGESTAARQKKGPLEHICGETAGGGGTPNAYSI